MRMRDLGYLLGSTKLGISVLAVIRDSPGRILLCFSDYKRPYEFSLPGGMLHGSETIEHGLVREVEEELGFEVRVVRALDARRRPIRRLELFYECEIVGGEFRASGEVSQVEFFEAADCELPDNLDTEHRAALLSCFGVCPGATPSRND